MMIIIIPAATLIIMYLLVKRWDRQRIADKKREVDRLLEPDWDENSYN